MKKVWAAKISGKKISGPKKIRPWNFQSLKFSGTKKFLPRKKLSRQFQRPRWFIPSLPVETIRQPESEASYWADAIFGSLTVALIRASPFHRVRCRFSGLIRKKAGLIHIKSPLHRRKIKRPNRPKCGHNLRRDRGVVCRLGKTLVFPRSSGSVNPDGPSLTKRIPVFGHEGMT